jgi:chemotaxis methyl-accepting protein methylase
MDTGQAIQEIDELFEKGWFKKAIELDEEVGKLLLEEQVNWVRTCSIHGQTSFFRDTVFLPILEHVVIPSFERRPVRIASVGCSDGREVYSTLIHFWNRRDELVLYGYDSNPKFIEEAKAGGKGIPFNSKGYRINSTYSERYYELDKWKLFGAEGSAYIVSPRKDYSWADLTFTEQARKMIQFKVHNIAEAPLPDKIDVFAVLNVLCHYSPKGRERILGNIEQSLADDGWLVCERCNPDSANAAEEYDKWMKNLSRFGFTKQTTIIPTWYSPNDDVSCGSRTYRKDTCINSKQNP